MRLIIDSDMAKMPRNCHECFLCYGGWCTVMPSEQDGMCPDSGRPEWCPLSIDAPVSQVIPVEWLQDMAKRTEAQAEPHFAFMYVLHEWQESKPIEVQQAESEMRDWKMEQEART